MRRRFAFVVCALGIVALAVTACGGSDDEAAPSAAPPANGNAQTSTPPDATSDSNGPAPLDQESDADTPPAETPPADGGPPPEADDRTDSQDSPPAEPPTDSDEDSNEPATSPPPPPERDPADLRLTPSEFPQPDPSEAVDVVPFRPEAFSDYGGVALRWLQGRTSVDAILPLFLAWRMPPVGDGARLNLVDTDGDAILPDDGRSAIVIVYTDPPTADRATGFSNLVVYEPLPDQPGRFRIVYDHDLVEQSFGATAGRTGIVVTSVGDVNDDGHRDISFQELVCDATGCRRVNYVLSNEADHYRRVIVP